MKPSRVLFPMYDSMVDHKLGTGGGTHAFGNGCTVEGLMLTCALSVDFSCGVTAGAILIEVKIDSMKKWNYREILGLEAMQLACKENM